MLGHLGKNPEREYMKIFGFITRTSLTGILTVVRNMCRKRFFLLYKENLILPTCFLFVFFHPDIKFNIKLNRCRAVFSEWRHRTVVLDAVEMQKVLCH